MEQHTYIYLRSRRHFNTRATLSANFFDVCPLGDALAELSLANYVEMRHKTATRTYALRKKIDEVLSALMPGSWIPLYSMVSVDM